MDYKKTVVEKNPEYVDRPLLLSKHNREGLFRQNGNYFEVRFDGEKGELRIRKISEKNSKVNRNPVDINSLRALGRELLGFNDPSVPKMLRYLVTPEMEVERIFNSLRYNYLKAVYDSGLKPSKYMDADYNRSFQALAGLTVYQGNTKSRVKDNDDFYRKPWLCKSHLKREDHSHGFKDETAFKYKEKENAKFVTKYIRKMAKGTEKIDKCELYAELISIKPGFHEFMMHSGFYNKGKPNQKEPRPKVLGAIRTNGNISNLDPEKVDNKLSHEIQYPKYLSYASCNVTEGPFVFRKNLSTFYLKEISKQNQKPSVNKIHNGSHELCSKFDVLLYPSQEGKKSKELSKTLKEAERFLKYP